MSKRLLSCLEKRDVLNQSAVSLDKLLQWGTVYEEEGLVHDAVDFYERAKASEPLERLLSVAREEGDSFLYSRILKSLDRDAAAEEWFSLGEKARELGKNAFAREAFKKGGMEIQEPDKTTGESAP